MKQLKLKSLLSEKKEENEMLDDLGEILYNAEDRIDGIYNPKAESVKQFPDINKRYVKLLKDINILIALINKNK